MGFWAGVRDVLVGRFDSDPVSVSATGDQLPQLLSRLWGSSAMGAPVSRDVALSVPAVARQHRIVASSIATLPLLQVDYDSQARIRSEFLDQIDPDVPNIVMIAQTIEDLIFDAISWWYVTEFGADNYPSSARRLEPGVVHMQPRPGNDRTPAPLPGGVDPRDQVIYLEGKLATPDQLDRLVRFDSPEPPLLINGARTLRRALLLDTLSETYADNPRPLDYLSAREGADDLDDDEVVALLDQWIENRRRRGTGYLPWSLEYNSVDQPTPADLQLVPLQQRVNVDLANLLGLDPEDVGASTTSRTYQNGVDRRKDRINDTLSAYMVAVAQRLSMRDITQPGRRVEWDLDDYLRADPATRATYFTAMHAMGAIGAAEVNRRERLGPLPVAAPAPARDAASAAFAADDDAVAAFEFSAAPAPDVDVARRTITGRVVPYGEVAVKNGQRFEFLPGSLVYVEMSWNKMLRDHDNAQGLGVLIAEEERADGRYATYRIARGAAGDEALALAQDGVLNGLSPGVDFVAGVDAERVGGVWRIRRADWLETSLVAMPAFGGSRVTSVTASRDQEGATMPCTTCGQIHDAGVACPTPPPTDPAPAGALPPPEVQSLAAAFSADQLAALHAIFTAAPAAVPPPAVPPRGTVNPARPGPATVDEPLPYRLSLARDPSGRNGMRIVFAEGANGYDFSSDLIEIANDGRGKFDAEDRVGALIRAQFDIDRADTAALQPNRNRPDMFVPQLDYATPLWDMINSGTTDSVPFTVPKFNSASGLVGPATEGVEPAPGSMTVTDQLITPGSVWGKAEITRHALRRGGNPQLSSILWMQMLREYYEDREASVATFLNTLTAAADITLTGTPAVSPTNANDQTTVNDLETALVDLNFVRGGNRFNAFAVHQSLFRVLARVKDSTGRPLYPIIAPQNANGTTRSGYKLIDIGGTTAVGAWSLGTPGTAPTNSWLFDPTRTLGWASAPERLDWNFGATVQQISGATGNVPQLSHVTVGIMGDIAFANLDINAVRQVIFDPSV